MAIETKKFDEQGNVVKQKTKKEKFEENCKQCVEKGTCRSECCGIVPIPAKTFDANKGNFQRQLKEIYLDKEDVYPITEDNNCVFLQEDGLCAIYPQRPKICTLFGSDALPCAYIKPNGNLRSMAERKQIQRRVQDNVKTKSNIYKPDGTKAEKVTQISRPATGNEK